MDYYKRGSLGNRYVSIISRILRFTAMLAVGYIGIYEIGGNALEMANNRQLQAV